MLPSQELQEKVAHWRQLSRAGQLTREQFREAIQFLAESRGKAAVTSAKARTKKAPPADSDGLLAQLDKL